MESSLQMLRGAFSSQECEPACRSSAELTMDVPIDGKGLEWIAAHDVGRLHLMDGVSKASILAASSGSLPSVKHLQARARENVTTLITIQGSHGLTEGFKKCETMPEHEKRRRHTARLMNEAAKQGCVAALTWLRVLCFPSLAPNDTWPMRAAAERGHLSIMKVLQQGLFPASCDWPVPLAAVGHWECLDWLCTRSCHHKWPKIVACILHRLASEGSLDVAIRLHQHYGPAVEQHAGYAMDAAARHGHLSMLQWLRELHKDRPWPSAVCPAATRSGSLELLQWLRAQQPPCVWTDACSSSAAAQGNLPILQWLRSQDPPVPWSSSCFEAAAQSGNVALFQWLQAQNAPSPIYGMCTVAAVKHGHLPMLQYLHSLGCGLDGILYYHAAARNSRHILRWLYGKAVPVVLKAPSVSLSNSLDLARFRLTLARFQVPMVMFLGDIHFPLPKELAKILVQARGTFCFFHGLVRWCRTAEKDTSKGMDQAFSRLTVAHTDGECLLVRLSRLPPELLDKIATQAELQHDLL